MGTVPPGHPGFIFRPCWKGNGGELQRVPQTQLGVSSRKRPRVGVGVWDPPYGESSAETEQEGAPREVWRLSPQHLWAVNGYGLGELGSNSGIRQLLFSACNGMGCRERHLHPSSGARLPRGNRQGHEGSNLRWVSGGTSQLPLQPVHRKNSVRRQNWMVPTPRKAVILRGRRGGFVLVFLFGRTCSGVNKGPIGIAARRMWPISSDSRARGSRGCLCSGSLC